MGRQVVGAVQGRLGTIILQTHKLNWDRASVQRRAQDEGGPVPGTGVGGTTDIPGVADSGCRGGSGVGGTAGWGMLEQVNGRERARGLGMEQAGRMAEQDRTTRVVVVEAAAASKGGVGAAGPPQHMDYALQRLFSLSAGAAGTRTMGKG